MLLDNGSSNLNRERREQIREAVLAVPQHQPQPALGPELRPALQFALGLLRDLSSALLCGGRMVRLVGPNHQPLERHEFESRDVLDARYAGRSWL